MHTAVAIFLNNEYGKNRSKMDSYQLFYDFKIGPKNAGYYTSTSKGDHIIMLAKFVLEGETYENLFEIKHDGFIVTAFKTGHGKW
jgi:hypothetical protein